MDTELKREDLLALLEELGGSDKASLQTADDEMLQAILRNKLNLIVDVAKIDSVLARPLPIEWRARLVARRIELENAARAVRDAAAGRQPPRGNLVVNIPAGVGISHYYGANGRVAVARVTEDGRAVLDLFAGEFKQLLMDRHHGLDWQKANQEILREAV